MGFDIAFGVLVLLAGLRGYKRGFASQMALLAGLALGVLFAEPAARRLLPLVAERVQPYPKAIGWALVHVGSAAGIATAVALAGWLYLRLYRQHVFGKNVPSLQDRFVGTALGLAKGAAIFCLLLFLVDALAGRLLTQPAIQEHYQRSRVVQLTRRFQPVEKLLQAPDVQRLRENVAQLVHYYRTRDNSAEPKAETAFTLPIGGPVPPMAIRER